jgi:hypothetical protein
MALPKLNTPVFELSLPSTNQKIKYRPFLVKEHKTLLAMQNADDNEVARLVRELVDVCTYNTLDIVKLPHFDVEYIFMNLRSKSIGEKVEVIVNCPCGNKIDASFNIDELKVVKNSEHTNKIMLTDDLGVEMSYPNFDTALGIFNSNDTSKAVDMVVDCVKGIFSKDEYWDAKEQTKDELEEFVFSLTKQQFEKLEQFFVTAPKVVQEVKAYCDQCGLHNETKIEGLSNFFV